MQFAIEIPDEHVPTVVGALCGMYGYAGTVTVSGVESANPESPAQFANRMTRKFLEDNVRAWAVKQAEVALVEARQNAVNFVISDPAV